MKIEVIWRRPEIIKILRVGGFGFFLKMSREGERLIGHLRTIKLIYEMLPVCVAGSPFRLPRWVLRFNDANNSRGSKKFTLFNFLIGELFGLFIVTGKMLLMT